MSQLYYERERPASTQASVSARDSDSQTRLYEGIRQARDALRPVIEAEIGHKSANPPAELVLDAAEQMLDAISMLVHDDSFWARIEAGERALGEATAKDVLMVSTILEGDLVGILDAMGHGPPPPSLTLAHQLQTGFHQAIHDPARALRGDVTRDARHHAAVFAYHLRPLVDAAQQARPNSHSGRLARRRVLAAVRAGGPAVVVGTIATGISSWFFPSSEGAALAGVLSATALRYGGNEAIQELTKRGIELGAMTIFTTALQGEVASAEPEFLFAAATDSLIRSAEQLVQVGAGVLDDASVPDPMLRASVIAATHCYFEFERARIMLESPDRSIPSRRSAGAVLSALSDLGDWASQGQEDADDSDHDPYDELADILARVELATEQLRSARSPQANARLG